MALWIDKETEAVEQPVFLKILEIGHGGGLIKVDARVPGCLHTLYEGTPLATCTTAGQYHFMKSAVLSTVHTGSQTATKIHVEWPHPFKAGDFVGLSIAGWDAASCTTILVAAETYLVTIVTEFDAPKHTVVYETAAAQATAPKHRPYGLLRHSVRVREDDGTTCYNVYAPIVFQGSALSSNYLFGYPIDIKNRLTHIRFVDKGQQ